VGERQMLPRQTMRTLIGASLLRVKAVLLMR